MSLRTWNAPYHLFTEFSSITTSSEMAEAICSWTESTVSRLIVGRSPCIEYRSVSGPSALAVAAADRPLETLAVLRHAEADDEENASREPHRLGVPAEPLGVLAARLVHQQDVVQARSAEPTSDL